MVRKTSWWRRKSIHQQEIALYTGLVIFELIGVALICWLNSGRH